MNANHELRGQSSQEIRGTHEDATQGDALVVSVRVGLNGTYFCCLILLWCCAVNIDVGAKLCYAGINFIRFKTVDGVTEEVNFGAQEFNNFYDFRECYKRDDNVLKFVADPTCLVITLPLKILVVSYRHLVQKHMQSIGRVHGIFFLQRKKADMVSQIMAHDCGDLCKESVYVFKARSRERQDVPDQFRSVFRGVIHSGVLNEGTRGSGIVLTETEEGEDNESNIHLEPADEKLKFELIQAWEDVMDPENLRIVVCAVCGSREQKSRTVVVDSLSVNLALLRNDDLPDVLQPKSYNFMAYDRAILNPKGLEDTERPGKMIMCQRCADGVKSEVMPKFALCNWLYYGRENLPDDIASEFSEVSIFERMLISRARCNSICCKFEVDADGEVKNRSSHLRKGIKGNVIVAPLDAMRLYDVLPPDVQQYCDTMSAVLVTDKMPTRATIEKLGPVLVRKSRVQKLLGFLLKNNLHYNEDTGLKFSQENVDAIHDHEMLSDVPRTVTVGHLRQDQALEGVNADYTPRNEDDFINGDRTDSLVMENMSYTEGDDSAQAYRAMKLLALDRCLSGKPFLVSGTGGRAVPDFYNPRILSWLFPHLDPWGIGGFYEPKRQVKLTMKEQLTHLLRSDDVCFEKDPEFAFVFFNVIRKAEVSRSVRFQVPAREQNRLAKELQSIDVNELRKLCITVERDPRYRPVESEQKRILDLMKSITMTTYNLPGSNGYKRTMRDQIKGIIHAKGCPTLFITINPSDVDHPVVRLFGGEDIDLNDMARGEDMDSWRRKNFAAQNPAACALFFDLMIQNFIKVILAHGTGRRGLYGICKAYYGTVEAQGKGTLHCHMLIWLRGHLGPEILRKQLMSSEDYRTMFIQWLESIIMNEFPMVTERRADEPDRSKRIRNKNLGEPHPATVVGPLLSGLNYIAPSDFWLQYKEQIIRLLNEYNWHEHNTTCYKYLKRGEQRSNENCCMRMDGVIYPETTIDEESGEIRLHRLHPWISSYSDVVTFLMKCNMNVQFVGSGNAARAFLYYVTDYITKADLPVHEGLTAVAYVLRKTSTSQSVGDKTESDMNIAALTKLVNAMMGRQEVSHQQVMSYLVGGGDHYTSEKFHSLYLGAFLRYISAVLSERDMVDVPDDDDNHQKEDATELVHLSIENKEVSINSQVYDYCLRSRSEPYNSMCLYDFVACTTKSKVNDKDVLSDSPHAFCSWDHPQRGTHRLGIKSKRVIPVTLGPSIPDRKSSVAAEAMWAKIMIVVFKPWRSPHELKSVEESWFEAYQAFETHHLQAKHRKIVRNMSVLSECRDAAFRLPRNAVGGRDAAEISEDEGVSADMEGCRLDAAADDKLAEWKERYSSAVFASFDAIVQCPARVDISDYMDGDALLERALGKPVSDALNLCLEIPISGTACTQSFESPERFSEDIHMEEVTRQKAIMLLKRKRCVDCGEENEVPQRAKKTRQLPATPFVKIDVLAETNVIRNRAFHTVVESIITDMNLSSNKEQMEAFLTVARHLGEGNSEQLLMFVSGVGGTGKSHVIKSIVMLFERTNKRKSLLLGAPTGSAAILIGGSTLHSLILETPNGAGKKNLTLLTAIWNDVSYLIIDEVSMMSAVFLSKLSNCMCRAKGDNTERSNKVFGGISVIFMGDLCQLKPPVQRALYSSEIIKNMFSEDYANEAKIGAMNGIIIWREVKKVVELIKNCRHVSDPKYAEFLSRLRVGRCVSYNSTLGVMDDYSYLQTRLLSQIQSDNLEELRSFADAPFIVGSKHLRDILNARLVAYHAERSNKSVNVYYSKDYCQRNSVPSGCSQYLWSLHLSYVRDSFGRLPLFEGMKVMVTENIAFDSKIVNGTEGVVRKVVYEEDADGRKYATVVYVFIEGIGFSIAGLEENVVPIFPARVRIEHSQLHTIGLNAGAFTRLQVPLVPAYAYTDFKSQGRTLTKAIVDIVTARGQGVYVMLSCVTSLSGVAILRWFPPSKVYTRLSDELRTELSRLGCRH